MRYTRTTDEALEVSPMRWTDGEVEAVIAWLAFRATLPADVAATLPLADVPGLPDLERCVLALVAELADERGVLARPLDALGARLGMHGDEWIAGLLDAEDADGEDTRKAHRRLVGRAARAGVWLREPLEALVAQGFLRALSGGVWLAWRPT